MTRGHKPSTLRTVVVVNDRAVPVGGASTVALESAVALARTGLHVVVFAGGTESAPVLDAAGVRVVTVDRAEIRTRSLGAAVSALWNVAARSRLLELLAEFDPSTTIVHVHSWSKLLSPSVFSAIARAGFRQVVTLHDYGFVCPNAALHDFPSGRSCERTPLSISCLTRNCDARNPLHKLWRVGRQVSLEQFARAHDVVDRAICVTDYSREVYKPHLPPALSLSTLRNPIAVEDLGPSDPASKQKILFIGRLSREKGALLLADAARHLGIGPVFVGEGELAAEILARCPSAVVTGWLSRAAVTEHIRTARAVVLPATWRETQGMVVPEALANGVPVIVSSNTAMASAVSHGETGLIFTNGDLASLVDALTLLRDNELVRGLGAKAYAHYWLSPATMSDHITGLCQIYRECLAKE